MKVIYLIVGFSDSGISVESAFTSKEKRDKRLSRMDAEEPPSDGWGGWHGAQTVLNKYAGKVIE